MPKKGGLFTLRWTPEKPKAFDNPLFKDLHKQQSKTICPLPDGYNLCPLPEDADEHDYKESVIEYCPWIISGLLDRWIDQDHPYMIVFETGEEHDNPHFHAAGTLKSTDQAVRTELNRCGYKGNKAYKFTAGDPELMDSHFDYLCKGEGTGKEDGPCVLFAHPDFTPAVISERNKIYWKVNAQLPKSKNKRSNAGSLSDMVLKVCRQKIEHGPPSLSEDQLIDITLEVAHRRSGVLNAFHLKSVVNHVAYSLNPDSNRVALLKNAMKF